MQQWKWGALSALAVAFCTGLPAASRAQTQSSYISQLAQFTAQSVTKQVSGELTSWGMAQLGFTSTSGTAQLVSLLKQVAAELAAVQQDVADLDCIDNAQDAQQAAARIQSAWNTYQLAVQDSYIDATTLEDWTNYVRGSGTNSLTSDITLITDDFTGQGSGQSILASCETAEGVAPPKEYTLDDRPAWTFSSNLIDYYADTEIVGVAMLADDFHLQAYQYWLAEGNTKDDTTTDNLPVAVCGNPPAGTPRAGACTAAASYYAQYRQDVVAVLDYGGAPYSTDQQLLLNGRGSLWVVDLNDFMTAGGYASSCVDQTSAGTPCGAGVGAAALSHFYKLDSTDDVSYGSYVTAWNPADTADWTDLLKHWGTDHLKAYLTGLGFDTASLQNRFFYTGETTSTKHELTLKDTAHFHEYEWACFVSPESGYGPSYDYGGQPFCNGLYDKLEYNHTSNGSANVCMTYKVSNSSIPINDDDPATQTDALISNFLGGQYQLQQECDSGKHVRGWEDPINPANPGYAPGWLLSYQVEVDKWYYDNDKKYYPAYDSGVINPVDPEYRWPVVNLDDYYQQHGSSCTAESTNRNGSGVLPSLCGPLLGAYVNAYIPPEPTGAVPALTVPDKTLVVLVDQREVADGAYLDVRQPADYADLVSAFDRDRGILIPRCFPPPGKALGLGITRVSCSATDLDGDSMKREFTVHVQYPFQLVQPLAGQDGVLRLAAGRRIKIEFTMNGYKGLDVLKATPTSTQVNCKTGESEGQPSYLSEGLRYKQAKDLYVQPWKTRRSWRHECRRLSLPLVDDTTRTLDLYFF